MANLLYTLLLEDVSTPPAHVLCKRGAAAGSWREGDHGEGEMPRLFGQVQLWQPVDPAHKQREV